MTTVVLFAVVTLFILFYNNDNTKSIPDLSREFLLNFSMAYLVEQALKLKVPSTPLFPAYAEDVRKFMEGKRQIKPYKKFKIKFTVLSLLNGYMNFNFKFLLPVSLLWMGLLSFILTFIKLSLAGKDWRMAFALIIGTVCLSYAIHRVSLTKIRFISIFWGIIGIVLIIWNHVYMKGCGL